MSGGQQYIYVYMASEPGYSGRVRYLKLGHGTDPKSRMADYTKSHTYVQFNISVGYIGKDTRKEKKGIKHSLRMWPIRGDATEARRIEKELAWFLHDKLRLENHYLAVLKQHLDGTLSSIYRTTKDGQLVWSDAKELHYLGKVDSDKTMPALGPTKRFHDAVAAIERLLREQGWLVE